jgi:O-acetyl-ADP-ribose deacetylase (regulator of RNase III)
MSRVRVLQGDITTIPVDVIVNAANEALIGGGGVDGAIHRAAGPGLFEECQKIGWCDVGDAKITGAYLLPARHVVHTVGPVWEGGDYGERELLAQCHARSLALAVKVGAKRISFPAISCGTYEFPVEEAAAIAVREVRQFLAQEPSVEEVVFVCFTEEATRAFESALAEG